MRLLFVTQDFPPDVGGIQTYSWELARRLAGRAEAARVIAPHRSGADSFDADAGVCVTRVSCRPDLLPLAGIPAVVRWARRLQVDAAFHAQWQTVPASLLARSLTGWPRRIACAAHGRELLFNPADGVPGLDALYDRLRRLSVSRADALFPVSRYTAGILSRQGAPPERLHVLPNGTDPQRFQPAGDAGLRDRMGLDGRTVLLTVGRLVRRKGIDTVLRALPALVEAVPDLSYLIVGTGPDRARLRKLASRLGITDHVQFVGEVPHDALPEYYGMADLFVMPARESPPDVEGFGIVFLEANACGTPAVGARSGGMPDAIVDGETGALVPPGDPDALVRTVAPMLQSPERLTRLGRNGRKRVLRDRNWDAVADDLFNHLERLT